MVTNDCADPTRRSTLQIAGILTICALLVIIGLRARGCTSGGGKMKPISALGKVSVSTSGTLITNPGGEDNTAVGNAALFSNSKGDDNVAIGRNSTIPMSMRCIPSSRPSQPCRVGQILLYRQCGQMTTYICEERFPVSQKKGDAK